MGYVCNPTRLRNTAFEAARPRFAGIFFDDRLSRTLDHVRLLRLKHTLFTPCNKTNIDCCVYLLVLDHAERLFNATDNLVGNDFNVLFKRILRSVSLLKNEDGRRKRITETFKKKVTAQTLKDLERLWNLAEGFETHVWNYVTVAMYTPLLERILVDVPGFLWWEGFHALADERARYEGAFDVIKQLVADPALSDNDVRSLLNMELSSFEDMVANLLGHGPLTVIQAQWQVLRERPIVDEIADAECRICFEDFGPGDEIATLDCRHAWHRKCILIWIFRNSSCPLCRLDLGPELNGERVSLT